MKKKRFRFSPTWNFLDASQFIGFGKIARTECRTQYLNNLPVLQWQKKKNNCTLKAKPKFCLPQTTCSHNKDVNNEFTGEQTLFMLYPFSPLSDKTR
jgi:hypothetical protein